MSKLTPQQRLNLLNEYKAGKTSGILSRKYGVTSSYVHALASRNGYRRDYSWHDKVRLLASRGLGPTELAERYHVTPQRISQIVGAA